MEGGNIPWYNTDCTSLRAEFQAAVNNGTNNVGTPSTNGGNN
jgi:hypothetical protein